jgi:hypothetical protein
MMEKPKVLVAAPIFDGMKYCLKEFLDGVRNLTYENCAVLLVDNSKRNEFYEELNKEEEVVVLKDDTKEELPVKRLVSSRNKILYYAIENGFDYVFMLDSDVVPPREAIEELLKCDKDIVSGLYWNNFMSSGLMKWLPVAWMPITEEEFEIIRQKMNFVGASSFKDLQRHMTSGEAESGELFEVLCPSAGCMLVSKVVFENIRYGVPEAPNGQTGTDDIYFIKKARESGFIPYCYTKVACEHLVKGKYKKDERGNLIHPLHPDYK